jgi:hypothetical protein
MSATCHAHLIFLDVMTLIVHGEEYELWSSLSQSVQPLVTLSLLGPCSYILSTLPSNTINLCSFLNVRDKL